MAEWELRPLSLGEILDRTFSLYRRHFLLFLGITAVPQLLILGLNLAQTTLMKLPKGPGRPPANQLQVGSPGTLLALSIGLIVGAIVYFIAYLFAQGATVHAVSKIYLGRSTTVGAALGQMWGKLFKLFKVIVLNSLAVLGATVFFIIPGIYVACRLLTCIPAALLEDLGARESLGRSWGLTKDNAGRSFVIYGLYIAMLYAIILLFMIPLTVMTAVSPNDPEMLRLSAMMVHVGTFLAEILVGPFLLIATSVFYYDLRVKKEAFDLQMMMGPDGTISSGNSIVPSMLS